MKIYIDRLTALAGLILLLSALGCASNNEEDLYPDNQCDTTNVTYAQTIAPIMTARCNICHSSGTASGGVVLDNYTDLQLIAASGLLWNVVSHASGYPPMPKDADKLPDCELNKIKAWLNKGYPNN